MSIAIRPRKTLPRPFEPCAIPAIPIATVSVHGDLAVADLPQRAGVLAGHPHGTLPLLGEAGVVGDQDPVSLAGPFEHPLDALAVEVVLVPVHGGEQALKSLLGGAGNILGKGIAVLVGQFGQQPSQVTFQGVGPLAPGEMDPERIEERGQLGHRLGGSLQDADSCVQLILAASLFPASRPCFQPHES